MTSSAEQASVEIDPVAPAAPLLHPDGGEDLAAVKKAALTGGPRVRFRRGARGLRAHRAPPRARSLTGDVRACRQG